MPFQCKLDRGRVALQPGPERSYEVLGFHRQQPFMHCAASDESRCRLRMLHRFEVMCGSARVQWVEVAAAITRLTGREAWVEAERLNVVIGQPARPASTECVDSPWPKLGTIFGNERPCPVKSGDRAGPRVVSMPPGFGPVTELGARFAAQPLYAAPPLAQMVAPAAAAGPSPAAPSIQQTPIAPPRTGLQRVASVSSGAQSRWNVVGPDSDTPYDQTPAAPVLAEPPPELVVAALPAAAPTAAVTVAPSPPPPQLVQPRAVEPAAPPASAAAEAAPAAPLAPAASLPSVMVAEAPSAPELASQRPIEVADAGSRLSSLSSWSVTVRKADLENLSSPVAYINTLTGGHTLYFVLALLSVSLAAVAIVVRWSTRHSADAGIFGRDSAGGDLVVRRRYGLISLEDPEERILMDLRRTADQLRTNAEIVLEDLKSAPPLRGVLVQELDLIASRLSDVPRPGSPPLAPRMLRQRYQGGIRELHRVIKIAEGAAASFSNAAYRPAVPTNRDEAYELLGVNDSVSDATLKKVVDALRMSWHPDHARDEVDRVRREERTKQINVAWDLVVGRRNAG